MKRGAKIAMQLLDKEKAYTLVELLASIVILSIIIIGIFQLFIFSGNTAKSNETKLVTTHLAKATIERVKIDYENFIPLEELERLQESYTINRYNCAQFKNCEMFTIKVNDLLYEVEITFSQRESHEKELNLFDVLVEVTQPDKNISSKLEGYVVHE